MALQLVEMQEIRDHGIPSSSWYICNVTPTQRLWEQHERDGARKEFKSQRIRMPIAR